MQKKIELKKNIGITELNPTDYLTDKNFIGAAILECLNNNDPEGVVEIINAYLDAVNKAVKVTKRVTSKDVTGHVLRAKNPTLRDLAQFVYTHRN